MSAVVKKRDTKNKVALFAVFAVFMDKLGLYAACNDYRVSSDWLREQQNKEPQ